MRTNALTPTERDAIHLKCEKESGAFNSKTIKFHAELQATYAGLEGRFISSIGHMIRFNPRQRVAAAFAAICSTPIIDALINMNRIAQKQAANLLTWDADADEARSWATSVKTTAANNNSLTSQFPGSMGVSEEVYQALHQREEIITFESALDLIEQRTQEALSDSFTGPLTQEFEAVRNGAAVFPLACEFRAHAELAEHGIKYIAKDNAYLFRTDILRTEFARLGETAELEKLEDITGQTISDDFVRIFKEQLQAAPEDTQQVTRMVPNYERSSSSGLQPIPIFR